MWENETGKEEASVQEHCGCGCGCGLLELHPTGNTLKNLSECSGLIPLRNRRLGHLSPDSQPPVVYKHTSNEKMSKNRVLLDYILNLYTRRPGSQRHLHVGFCGEAGRWVSSGHVLPGGGQRRECQVTPAFAFSSTP